MSRTDTCMDGQTWKQYTPPQTKFAGGIKTVQSVLIDRLIWVFNWPTPWTFLCFGSNMSCHTKKPNKITCAPSKNSQPGRMSSLIGVVAVAWRNIGLLTTNWAHSDDSDQTGRMPRLIWVFTVCICHFVGFVMWRLIWFWSVYWT